MSKIITASTTPAATRRLVITRTPDGGITVREPTVDPSVPFSGRLLGYTRRDLIGWVACWRVDNRSETQTVDVASGGEAERLLREALHMPARPTEPCIWCGMDPETPYCCGGEHPDRWTMAAAADRAPEIHLAGTAASLR